MANSRRALDNKKDVRLRDPGREYHDATTNLFPTTALIAAALLAAPGLATTPAEAADFTLKYGVVTQGDMQHLYGLKLKEVVEKATNGRVEVKVFPGGQLGCSGRAYRGTAAWHDRGLFESGGLLCWRRLALR